MRNNMNPQNAASILSVNDTPINDKIETDSKHKANESAPKIIAKIFVFSISTVAVSIIFVLPWTTIPRTNSIIYQSSWMEVFLPTLSNLIIGSGTDLLNLTVWTKENTLMNVRTFLKMLTMNMTSNFLLYILGYVIWCVYLGYNHPLPFVGLLQLPALILFMISLWFLLPTILVKQEDFRRKLRVYTVYLFWCLVPIIQNEILSSLFTNVPVNIQFIVPFMLAACREFDKRMRSKLVKRMMGQLDDSATALLGITISTTYSFFVAIRLAGATIETVFCFVFIDFVLHSRITYTLIKEYNNNRKVEDSENGSRKICINVTKIILPELVEGFTPLIYGISMALAYYGPNANLFVNMRSNFWGKPIEDINRVFISMAFLFAIDTISAVLNSLCLWYKTNINMFQEFCGVLRKYWMFMAVKLSWGITNYFASRDVNLGSDSSGKFAWITPKGWQNLIYNSTDLTHEEKITLLYNNTLI